MGESVLSDRSLCRGYGSSGSLLGGEEGWGLPWERGESEKGLVSGEVLSGIMENLSFEPRRALTAWSLITLGPHPINM